METKLDKLANNASLTLKEVLEYQIFSLGKYSLNVYEILGAVIVVILGMMVSKLVKKLIYKSDTIDIGKKFAFSQMIHYIIVIIVFFLAMKSLGVNISPLLVGSGALLVGVGLGLQNLFLDFISGVIILLDRSIKVGDMVEIDGNIGRVQEIKTRTTTLLTRDNKSTIFPNSLLTKNKLINYSHNDNVVRFEILVGVHYNTDLEKAEKLMIEAAIENESILKDPKPMVRFENFGDSSLELKLLYCSTNLFNQPGVRSDIRTSILNKFRQNGVQIPFPTRTLEIPKEFFKNRPS